MEKGIHYHIMKSQKNSSIIIFYTIEKNWKQVD
jgi:hypothetical protein